VRFRTRAILAGSVLAIGLITFAPLASAQDTTGSGLTTQQVKDLKAEAKKASEDNGSTKADAECISKLVDGGKVDDCHKAPSPILPATDELVWGVLSFAVLFLVMRQFAYPAIKEMMQNRSDRIKGDLDAAEAAKAEAVDVLDKYRADLADAKSEAGRIIEQARQSAEALKRDQESRLQSELADLRGEVAQLAIGAAEVVVSKNLDQATQVQLIEDYINQVANQR
jgi:F-type H+-transporting ATPase subunit b